MHFSRKQKNCLIALTLCLFLTISVIWQPSSYAWLTSEMRSTTFSVKSSDVSEFDSAELWVYSDKKYTGNGEGLDRAKGWNTVVMTSSSTNTDKFFRNIGIYNDTYTAFQPQFLYFGTINNLVQEQENLPIFLKFKIKLKKNSSNVVKLYYDTGNYEDGDYYVDVYKNTFSGDPNTFGYYQGTLVEELKAPLSNTEEYPFLRFRYFVSHTDEYNLDSGNKFTLGDDTEAVDFPTLFNNTTVNGQPIVEYTDNVDTHSVVFNNTSTVASDYAYIYVKISVNSEALAKALTDSALKNNMPAYLTFKINLGLEIQTSALPSS